MKFRLYVELASRAQTSSEVLELLKFPRSEVLPTSGTWKFSWWSRGRQSTRKILARQKILTSLAKGFNELRIWYTGALDDFKSKDSFAVESAVCWFNPAPTSALWAPVPREPLKSHKNEQQRKSFGGGHPIPDLDLYLHPYPSVLEADLNIRGKGTLHDPNDLAVEFLITALSPELIDQEVIGYGCVGGMCRRQMMLHNLGGVPAAIDQLGDKFEELYPILIGPRRTCEGLVYALGGIAKLHLISTHSPSAIVSIPPEQINGHTRDLADNWIIDLPALVEEYREEVLRRRNISK